MGLKAQTSVQTPVLGTSGSITEIHNNEPQHIRTRCLFTSQLCKPCWNCKEWTSNLNVTVLHPLLSWDRLAMWLMCIDLDELTFSGGHQGCLFRNKRPFLDQKRNQERSWGAPSMHKKKRSWGLPDLPCVCPNVLREKAALMNRKFMAAKRKGVKKMSRIFGNQRKMRFVQEVQQSRLTGLPTGVSTADVCIDRL